APNETQELLPRPNDVRVARKVRQQLELHAPQGEGRATESGPARQHIDRERPRAQETPIRLRVGRGSAQQRSQPGAQLTSEYQHRQPRLPGAVRALPHAYLAEQLELAARRLEPTQQRERWPTV